MSVKPLSLILRWDLSLVSKVRCRRQGVRAANPQSRLHYTCILPRGSVIPKSAPINQPIHKRPHVQTRRHTSTQGSALTRGRDRRADANQATVRCQTCSAGRCAPTVTPSLRLHLLPSPYTSYLPAYQSYMIIVVECRQSPSARHAFRIKYGIKYDR